MSVYIIKKLGEKKFSHCYVRNLEKPLCDRIKYAWIEICQNCMHILSRTCSPLYLRKYDSKNRITNEKGNGIDTEYTEN